MKSVRIKALKEFSDKEIRKQSDIAKNDPDEEKRKRAHRFKMEMMAYNARALRGDFDTY